MSDRFDNLVSQLRVSQGMKGRILEALSSTMIDDENELRAIIRGMTRADATTFFKEDNFLDKFAASALAGLLVPGKRLTDGLPRFQQNITASTGSIPRESEHALCERVESPFPFVYQALEDVHEFHNSSWAIVDQSRDVLFYTSKNDIVYYVRIYLENILQAMKLPLGISAEIAVKNIRPDLCVLVSDHRLVGVVQVKKPGAEATSSILLQPTVLGELFDQMLLVEGFYGMGPVCGILTTGEEWLVAWFRADEESLQGTQVSTPNSFHTPEKPPSTSKKENISRGATPSQKSPQPHSIVIDVSGNDGDEAVDDTTDISEEQSRHLITTRVFQQHDESNPDASKFILDLLCSAFLVMVNAHLYHRPGVSQCLFKFHHDKYIVTWHPASHDTVYKNVDFNRFPRINTSALIALEDLGRGSTGKAWLCVNVSKPHSAACVLKFSNREGDSNLKFECENWKQIYPEFEPLIRLQMWSGSNALMMPHCAPIASADRDGFKDAIRALLLEKFVSKNLVHPDVRWRNIGQYKNFESVYVPVIFDLHDVYEYGTDRDLNWVDIAMNHLYPDDEFR